MKVCSALGAEGPVRVGGPGGRGGRAVVIVQKSVMPFHVAKPHASVIAQEALYLAPYSEVYFPQLFSFHIDLLQKVVWQVRVHGRHVLGVEEVFFRRSHLKDSN